MILHIYWRGAEYTVTCPDGQLVFDGTNYVNPTTTDRVALFTDTQVTIPNPTAVDGSLSYNSSANQYQGKVMANINICTVISAQLSADVAIGVKTAPPVSGAWISWIPQGTVKTQLPMVTQS
jgi:hypothetical protein